MEIVGTDKPRLANTAYDSLSVAANALANSANYEQNAIQQRSSIASSGYQQLGQASNATAESQIKQLQLEQAASDSQYKVDSQKQSSGGLLGAVVNAASGYLQVREQVAAKNRELDITETNLKNDIIVRTEKGIADQRSLDETARAKQLEQLGKYEEAQAQQELLDHRTNYQEKDRFRVDGKNIYLKEQLDILSKYRNISPEALKKLTEEVYAPASSFTTGVLQRENDQRERLRLKTMEVEELGLMQKLNASFNKLKASGVNDPSPILAEINNGIKEFMSRDDIDEETRLSTLSSAMKATLSSLDTSNAGYYELESTLKNVQNYSAYMVGEMAAYEKGERTPQQLRVNLQERRIALRIPSSYDDLDTNMTDKALEEGLARQKNIEELKNRGVIDAAKGYQLSNNSLGYVAAYLITNQADIARLKEDKTYGQLGWVKSAISLAEQYERVRKGNQAYTQKIVQLQKDLVNIRAQGVKWFISNSPTMKEPSVASIIGALSGDPTKQTAAIASGGLTPEQINEYNAAQSQIESVIASQIDDLRTQQKDDAASLTSYGLNGTPEQIRQLLVERKKTYDAEMESFNSQIQGKLDSSQIGIPSPFKTSSSQSQASTTKRQAIFSWSYSPKQTGIRLPYSGGKGVLPFLPNVTGISMGGQNWGEARPGGRRTAGEDIGTPNGTPLVSYIGGTVVNVRVQPDAIGYGQYVDIKGDDGMIHRFAHMQVGSVSVRKGQRIEAGTVFGKTGASGTPVSNPQYHVHWEVRKDYTTGKGSEFGFKDSINPLSYVVNSDAKVSNYPKPVGAGQPSNLSDPKVISRRIPEGALQLPGGRFLSGASIGTLVGEYKEAAKEVSVASPLRTGYAKSRQTKPGEVKNSPKENYGYAELEKDSDFKNSIASVSNRLGIPAVWLVDLMALETGGTFKPDIVNTNAPSLMPTGLIQFTADTARRMGTSTAALQKMSRVQQMEYVYRYLLPFKKDLWRGVEFVQGAVWGGEKLVNRLKSNKRKETINSWGESNGVTLKTLYEMLGRRVGRRYDIQASSQSRTDRLLATTHTGYENGCKVCEALRLQGVDPETVAHESQPA